MHYEHKLSLANHRIKDIEPILYSIYDRLNKYYSLRRTSKLRQSFYDSLTEFLIYYKTIRKKRKMPELKKVDVSTYPLEIRNDVCYNIIESIKHDFHTISMYINDYANIYSNTKTTNLFLSFSNLIDVHNKLIKKEEKNIN